MAIKNFENGRVEIGGKVVRRRTPDEMAMVGQRPKFVGRLEYALSLAGFGVEADKVLQSIGNNDDEFLRVALADFEDSVREAYLNSMKPGIAKVGKVMADPRYTLEAKRNEAREMIEPARAEWIKAASKYMADLIGGLRDIENLLLLALEPWTDRQAPLVLEARARECREAVLSLPAPERAKMLLDLGAKGALEPLHALKSDPLKREAASADILIGAREAAIEAQDGGWLLFDWRQQKRVVEAAGARLAGMEVGTNYGLRALGLEGYDGNASQWTQLANAALEKSEKVLV
jgi:hypothetical protein